MPDKLESINPADGSFINSYPITSTLEVEGVLKLATECFESWRKESLERRAKVLNNIALELRKQKEHLAMLATLEMGKPIQQGREEVEKCAGCLEYYATHGAEFLADDIIKTEAQKSYVSFQPIGVVLAIMPWNFPYWQVFRAFAPTVMAGNVVILKHASNVTGCALAIAQIILEGGAPQGLMQTLVLPSSSVSSLIDHKAVAAITLTGSTNAGRKVAEAAGRNLKKVVLELGGSDAYVILADADVDEAAEICVNGR